MDFIEISKRFTLGEKKIPCSKCGTLLKTFEEDACEETGRDPICLPCFVEEEN